MDKNMANQIHLRVRKAALVAVLLGISLLWMGCRTTGEHINWYQGPQRATNEVGLLKLPRDLVNGHTVFVHTIDGTNLSKTFTVNNTTHIELLPGNHTLGLWFLAGTEQSLSEYKISFNCEAGHVYGAYMSPTQVTQHDLDKMEFLWGGKFPMTAWIVDGQTEQVVAGHRDTKYFFARGGLTGFRTNEKGVPLPHLTFAPQDMVGFELSVQVDDLVNQLKASDVAFKWYSDTNLVSESSGGECSFSFDGSLNIVRLRKQAFTLGLGHFKIIALIEGEEVASQEFDIGP